MMLYQLIAARFPFWCAFVLSNVFICSSLATSASRDQLSIRAGPAVNPPRQQMFLGSQLVKLVPSMFCSEWRLDAAGPASRSAGRAPWRRS